MTALNSLPTRSFENHIRQSHSLPGIWMNWTFVKVTTDEAITGWGIELYEKGIAKHRYPED